jgi:hypothetical protein
VSAPILARFLSWNLAHAPQGREVESTGGDLLLPLAYHCERRCKTGGGIMASHAPGQQQPRVFISYAHESDELRASVRALGDWLVTKGCVVLTDHPFVDRAPPKGWPIWMLDCIKQASVVLVVCTPKLKARFEKDAPADEGQGATYEGSIVTRAIYGAAMHNEKFFPIVPDGGRPENIPDILQDWRNDHHFPSGNERIRRLIFNETPGATPGDDTEAADAEQRFGCHHEQLVADRLGARDAQRFLRALQQEFRKKFQAEPPRDAASMVNWVAARDSREVQKLFYLVRRALDALSGVPREDPERKAAEEAAVALYSLSAMRLVDGAVARANEVRPHEYLVYVPRSEHVICAIIATALFGGELHLKPVDASGVLQPEYVFDVQVLAAGDHITEAFECAAYAAVFRNESDVPNLVLDSGRLIPAQRARLAARIDDIKDQQRSIALVVHGLKQVEAAAGLANEHEIPVLLPATELPTTDFTTKLLGMDADRLIAEVAELSRRLTVVPGTRPQPQAAPPT